MASAGAGSALGCGMETRPSLIPTPGNAFPASAVRGSRKEIDAPLEVLAGELPKGLHGHALVVTSLPYDDGTPLFTGDAMIYRVSFDQSRPHLRSRLLRTPCYRVDAAVGDTPGLRFRNSGFVRMSSAFGARNFGNTALVPIQDGRLLATYDAGRPWEIDPSTLEVITPVGLQDAWQPFLPPATPGLDFFRLNMSSAHPAYDPDDRMTYTVNYATRIDGSSVEPFVRVLFWDGQREPQSTLLVDERGEPVALHMSCHQLHVTKHHVVLLDGAFQIESEQVAGQDVTRPQRPESVLWFVKKRDLAAGGTTLAQRVVIPIEAAHFLIDRDDSDDTFTLLLAHQNAADPSEWVRENDVVASTGRPVDPMLVPMMVAPADQALLGRYVVDLKARRVVDARKLPAWALTLWGQDMRPGLTGLGHGYWGSIGFEPELLTQRIVDAYRDHPYRQIPVDELPTTPTPASLMRIDHTAMRVDDIWEWPRGYFPNSPTFLPKAGGARDEGFVMTFAVGPTGDEIWLFDASDIAYGPRCRLGHRDFDIPFTLHSVWLAELRPSAAPAYVADPKEDYGRRLMQLPGEARAIAVRALGMG